MFPYSFHKENLKFDLEDNIKSFSSQKIGNYLTCSRFVRDNPFISNERNIILSNDFPKYTNLKEEQISKFNDNWIHNEEKKTPNIEVNNFSVIINKSAINYEKIIKNKEKDEELDDLSNFVQIEILKDGKVTQNNNENISKTENKSEKNNFISKKRKKSKEQESITMTYKYENLNLTDRNSEFVSSLLNTSNSEQGTKIEMKDEGIQTETKNVYDTDSEDEEIFQSQMIIQN